MLFRFAKNSKRFISRSKRNDTLLVKSLKAYEYGKPADVLRICEDSLTATNPNQVLVKILASPIHPTDVDLIKGEPHLTNTKEKHEFPLTPGIECVAEVIGRGCNVTCIPIGQHVVVPYMSERGTWTTHALFNIDDVMPIPNKLNLAQAATLSVNPCTAYRMLKDFVVLKPGDTVILNGSTTGLGQAIHKLCKVWDLNSVGIVQEDPKVDEVKEELKCLGATEVLTLPELRKTDIFNCGKITKPRLAISIVARSSTRELADYLAKNGVMVTYGSMAGKQVATATAAFIFKDFVQRPFWMTRWSKYNPDTEEREKMYGALISLIENENFQSPECQLIPFAEYKVAFKAMDEQKGAGTEKNFLLDMACEA